MTELALAVQSNYNDPNVRLAVYNGRVLGQWDPILQKFDISTTPGRYSGVFSATFKGLF